MSFSSAAFVRQKLCVDYAALKHACPKGVYVAPVPDHPVLWTGVLFVRKGPYMNAVLRFQIDFGDDYPQRPPVVTFQSDVFHPLVTPLTTYTYSSRDFATDPAFSAVDNHRLPPGGLSLRHGFPEWFQSASDVASRADVKEPGVAQDDGGAPPEQHEQGNAKHQQLPHVVELLQYIRVVFDTEEVLDSIPLDAAANNGAWHAWRSYRSKTPAASRATSVARSLGESREQSKERSASPRQQPGGARRPGEWNWQGVWEDRVRKSVNASLSEPVLYGGESNDVINFFKIDQETLSQISPIRQVETAT
ncbi:hypothetical protein PRZ48_004628 [Zasmidium cellare]|uniref:UBC core domain-containing protein n=1 Tax=Zasmidium cellare TaxID=395010 RepID=A0ABR0ERI4_ZASCE|nr:hypothetical protein PRZ48_004628 [Zasmidium cellare]